VRRVVPIVLMSLAAAVILLAHFGAEPLDEREARCAVAARGMLATGRLLTPGLGGEMLSGEPLIGSWQSLPFGIALGMTEFTGRVPSVFWAFVLLLATYGFAQRWFDAGTAALSAGVLATTYVFVRAGWRATPEMARAALVMLGLWYFARHRSDHNRAWLYGLGLMVGFGAGLAGPWVGVVALVAIAALSFARRDFGWARPTQALLLAVLLCVAAFLVLPLARCAATGSWEPWRLMWWESLVEGCLYVPLFFGTVLLGILWMPWLVFLPISLIDALARLFRKKPPKTDVLVLVALTVAVVAWRSSDLVLAVSLTSLVVGHLLARWGRGETARWTSHAVRVGAIAMGVAFIAFILIPFAEGVLITRAPRDLVVVGLWAIGGLVFVASATWRRPWAMVAGVAAASIIPGLLPSHGPWLRVRASAQAVKELNRPVAFLNWVNAQAAFYLSVPYEVLGSEGAAEEWVRRTSGLVIIAPGVPVGPLWRVVADAGWWRALEWKPSERAVALTRDPGWLARHPLRGIKSESLTYVFSAESGIRFNLGTVTMRLGREETKDGRELVITAESKGGVPGYPMASTITSRLRDSDLAQLEADDLRTKPSFKHRRFTWFPEGVDYRRHDHCKDKACRNPLHMVTRRDGSTVHCTDKRCTNPDHRVWRLKEAFRAPGARDSWHVIAACYIARGFDLRPGAPPQVIRVINNQYMWDVALRGVEERTIAVPAGKFECLRLAFDATPVNKEAKESADEAEGPFGLTGHVELYVDKATKLLVLLDGQIELGATFKVQVMLTKREAEAQP